MPKRKIGRPTKAPVDGERVQLSLRVTPQIKRKLDSAALASGRSQSQEVELRLEISFREDNMMMLLGAKAAARRAKKK